MIWLLPVLALPTAQAGPLRALPKAGERGKVEKLVRGLDHKRSYARALAAEELAALQPSPAGVDRLLTCVADGDERDWVRSACATALGSWRVDGAVETNRSASAVSPASTARASGPPT